LDVNCPLIESLHCHIYRSLTNVVVKSKRETKACAIEGRVVSLFGLTITKGPVEMPMANAYGKITGFVKEPYLQGLFPFLPGWYCRAHG
jgi:hypothetical protein